LVKLIIMGRRPPGHSLKMLHGCMHVVLLLQYRLRWRICDRATFPWSLGFVMAVMWVCVPVYRNFVAASDIHR
jgi:hypothetical protein